MDYLPIFLDLRARDVVVIGGGEVALRKVRTLLRAGAQVTVVAPRQHPELAELTGSAAIQQRAESFTAAHLRGAVLVIAATDDAGVNAAVAAAARAANIPVNVVDDRELSTCLMPAIIDRAPLIVAVGSGGASPTLARRVRAQIEALLPATLGDLAAAAGRWRERVHLALPEEPQRRRFWDRLVDVAATLTAERSTPVELDRWIGAALAAAVERGPTQGEVWLIGAGPGDADLLTLRALQLLQQCDVVLHDRLVSTAVLERVRRDARRVFVGKETGRHRTTQARIHQLLLEYAGRGLRVARLKGGDPFVFGRGGEEITVLAAAGVPVTVVPGVTAALAAAAVAGIPLTWRGVAQSVTFVTAMGEAAEQLDWRALAAPLQTAVFYMGVAQLPRIVEHLRAHGAPHERAVAIVERATLPGQRVLRAELGTVVSEAQRAAVAAPALLIVGEVARSGGSAAL